MDSDNSSPHDGVGELAPLACSTCKKQKRKCDKQLPSCGLCVRIGRLCQYTAPDGPGDSQRMGSEDFEQLRQRVNDLESQLASSKSASSNGTRRTVYWTGSRTNDRNSSDSPISIASLILPATGFSDFPSIFFMDSWAFAYSGQQVQVPHVRSPAGALESLGSSYELRALIEEYFATVHRYFPIVSKIRLYQHLSNPLHEPGAEFLLLFMTMKLLVTETSSDSFAAQASLYRDVKTLYTHIESHNGLTIQTLQALLLIALFEIGNSIWPAAYLTTGACVRLGHVLGIHSKNAVPMLPKPTTWTEQEERRRVAWAMFVLDRYANVGQHHRPPACEDPSIETILPTDDRDWDRGQMSATAPLSLSAIHKTTSISPFARLCQATHLLSKVMRHTDDTSMTADYLADEAVQLDVTVRALLEALRDEMSTMDQDQIVDLYSAVGVCLSAAMTLYDKYSCSTSLMNAGVTEIQVRVHKMCIDGISETVDRTSALARVLEAQAAATTRSRLSPFVVDCLYSAASTYAWYVRESSDPNCVERLREIKSVLRVIDGSWRAAGEAIRIVESTEFHLDNL